MLYVVRAIVESRSCESRSLVIILHFECVVWKDEKELLRAWPSCILELVRLYELSCLNAGYFVREQSGIIVVESSFLEEEESD